MATLNTFLSVEMVNTGSLMMTSIVAPLENRETLGDPMMAEEDVDKRWSEK